MGAESLMHADISDAIIGAAIEVHRELGPGLLESAYSVCLADELIRVGCQVEREVEQPIAFKGRLLSCGYRIDLIVDRVVLVELKSVEQVLLTYMRLAQLPVGLLINFNVKRLRDGLTRRVLSEFNQAVPPRSPRLRGESHG